MKKTQAIAPSGPEEQGANICFNPNGLPTDELPVVYGFDNGNSDDGFAIGVLIDADGERIAECETGDSEELQQELGLLGTPALMAALSIHCYLNRKHPDGYVTKFVKYEDVLKDPGLQEAIEKSGGNTAGQAEPSKAQESNQEYAVGDVVQMKKGCGKFFKAGTLARLAMRDSNGCWWADFGGLGNPSGSYLSRHSFPDGRWYVGDADGFNLALVGHPSA